MTISGFAVTGSTGRIGVLSATELVGGYRAFLDLPTIDRSSIETSATQVVTDLLLPPGAVVTQVLVRITADAPGVTTIGGIATVRAAAGDPTEAAEALVIDFGTLRTVAAVAAPVAITSVAPWLGTTFGDAIDLVRSLDGRDATFTELQTERLLVTLASARPPADVARDGLVITTTPPADLELLVGARRVFVRAGPAPAAFTTDVDVTAEVQAVVDAGGIVDEDGNLPVRVTLSARVPGDLGLSVPEPPRFLRTTQVDFPGPSAPVLFADEGLVSLPVPLPPEAGDWTIHRVIVTVAADDPGPVRVLPNVGPGVSGDAELVLDPDRRLVVRLPAGPLRRFAEIAGVRLLLTPQAGGIEVGGALHSGTATEPGPPVGDATVTPLSLPAGPPRWVTLSLARPVRTAVAVPDQDAAAWVSLAVTRGSATLALTDPDRTDPDDVALLRRIAPNGLTRSPSTVVRQRGAAGEVAAPIATDVLALRVVGLAPEEAPIPIASVALAGGRSLVEEGPAGSYTLSADPPGRRRSLRLDLTTTAATRLVVGPVIVAYTEEPGRRGDRSGRTP